MSIIRKWGSLSLLPFLPVLLNNPDGILRKGHRGEIMLQWTAYVPPVDKERST
jgi:hypothetical protein